MEVQYALHIKVLLQFVIYVIPIIHHVHQLLVLYAIFVVKITLDVLIVLELYMDKHGFPPHQTLTINIILPPLVHLIIHIIVIHLLAVKVIQSTFSLMTALTTMFLQQI